MKKLRLTACMLMILLLTACAAAPVSLQNGEVSADRKCALGEKATPAEPHTIRYAGAELQETLDVTKDGTLRGVWLQNTGTLSEAQTQSLKKQLEKDYAQPFAQTKEKPIDGLDQWTLDAGENRARLSVYSLPDEKYAAYVAFYDVRPESRAFCLENGAVCLDSRLTLGLSMEGLPEEWVQVRNLPVRTEYAGFPMEVTLEADEAGKLRSVKAISQDELTTDQQEELRKTLSQDYGLPLTAVQNREEQPRSWLMDEGGYRVDMSLLASSYGDGEVVIEVYAQPTAK